MDGSSIACPNCGVDVSVGGEAGVDTLCPTCGSSIAIVPEETVVITKRTEETRFLGRFHLLETIGRGAYGQVWKARDASLDRLVAIKIPRDAVLDATEREMFLRDARAAARLDHQNIVPIHEVGEEDGTIYIVSSLIDGVTLADRLTAGTPTIKEAVRIATAITDAVEHAHENGIVHRDLKPSNVLLDANEVPYVIDFGLAKEIGPKVAMTLSGQVLGTPAYMSPEQARGRSHEVDARSDVYSLGVMLFELLTGERPFRGNVRMMLQQVMNDDPPNPRRLNGAVAVDLSTIALKCLEKDPGRRYATARELADDLRRYTNDEPILARPPSLLDRTAKLLRRHWKTFATATAFVLVLSTVVTIAFVRVLAERNRAFRAAASEMKSRTAAEEAARKEAEVRRVAIDSLKKTMETLSNDKTLHSGPFEDLRQRLLDSAEETFLSLQKYESTLEAGQFEELRTDLVSLAESLGDGARALRILEDAPPLPPDDDTLTRAELWFRLRRSAAELRVAERVGNAERVDALCDRGIALIESNEKTIESEVEMAEPATFLTMDIAFTLNRRGRPQDALEVARLGQRLVDIDSMPVCMLQGYGWNAVAESDAHRGLGRLQESITIRRELRDLLEERFGECATVPDDYPDLRRSICTGLGNAWSELDKPSLARPEFEKSVEWSDQAAARAPSAYTLAFSTGMTRYNLANCLGFQLGENEVAENAYREAITIWSGLHDRDPRAWEPVHWLAAAKSNLADILIRTSRFEEGESLATEAIELRESFPGSEENRSWGGGNWHTFLGVHYYVRGRARVGRGETDAGLASMLEGCRIIARELDVESAGEWRRGLFALNVRDLLIKCNEVDRKPKGLAEVVLESIEVSDGLLKTSTIRVNRYHAARIRFEAALLGGFDGPGEGPCDLLRESIAAAGKAYPFEVDASLEFLVRGAVEDDDCVVPCHDLLHKLATQLAERSSWKNPYAVGALATLERRADNLETAVEYQSRCIKLCEDWGDVTEEYVAEARRRLAEFEKAASAQ